jgi:hypothetical protein
VQQVRKSLAREATSKTARFEPTRMRSSSKTRKSKDVMAVATASTAAVLQEAAVFQPAFSADSGEIRVKEARYVLFQVGPLH